MGHLMLRHGSPPEAARAICGGTNSTLPLNSRVLLDTSHPIEQIACQQRYHPGFFCTLIGVGISICRACRSREMRNGTVRIRGPLFPCDGTPVSHRQLVDVDVKKLTKSPHASSGTIGIPPEGLTRCYASRSPT